MNDLIWIGNTLYPRWFVLAVPIILITLPFALIGIVRLCKWTMGLGHP